MRFSALKIHSLSGWTMFIFGILAIGLGIVGIINPETTLQLLNFDVLERTQRADGDFTITFLIASSMASFNMGVYYVLAALTNWKPFFYWTVPFRLVTFTVFTVAVVNQAAPQGFIGVAAWELIGAIATGAALWYERPQKPATK
ncbi:MAG: hypothetical protein Kow00117_13890 [Phototrophicales bacterium]